MLQGQFGSKRARSWEIFRLWALSDGTRCVLVALGDTFELQLLQGPRVLRRAPCADFRRAHNTAQQWRVDYEIDVHDRIGRRPTIPCPECGDDASVEPQLAHATPSLVCRSCGNTWPFATADRQGEGMR